jgi:hypothetical protein
VKARFGLLLVAALVACNDKSGATLMDAGDAAADAAHADAGDGGDPDASASILDTNMPQPASEELSSRMRHLLEAIAQDNADLAGDVLFPRDAYISTKDATDPQKAWEKKLSGTFKKAVERTHKRNKGIEGAKFVSFELGKTVAQVAPKKRDWKKPLWRVKHSKLTYTVDGKTKHIEIAEMTAWRGAWYVTRLR